MRTRLVVALCVVSALTIGVATAYAGGGNSANAKLCQKGGWQTLIRSDGSSFVSEEDCVSYGAQGGTLHQKSKSQLDCEAQGGTFDHNDLTGVPSADVVVWTCNGSAIVEADIQLLQSDCLADGGNVFYSRNPNHTCVIQTI
jgi:hypothetical protein